MRRHRSLTCLTPRCVGQPATVDSYHDDGMLEPSESLDSDEVVDPTDQWIDADGSESLDEKLAADNSDEPSEDWPSTALTRPSTAGKAAKLTGFRRTATRSNAER